MSFSGLKPVHRCINIGPGSSFTANIVGVSLETHHSQVRDGVRGCGHLKEFNFLDGGCKLPPKEKMRPWRNGAGKVEEWRECTHTHTYRLDSKLLLSH